MTRKSLIVLFCISLLLSFSAQAGHRDKHYKKQHYGHVKKHHRHHQHHARDHHWRGCRHVRHDHYVRYARPYVRPHFELGAQFAYSADGTMIIYQPYLHGNVGY